MPGPGQQPLSGPFPVSSLGPAVVLRRGLGDILIVPLVVGLGHPVAGDLSLPPVFVNKQQAVDRDGAFCTDAQGRRPLSSPNIAQKNFAVNIDKRRGFLYTVL